MKPKEIKELFPALYINHKIDKRGKGEMKDQINVRMNRGVCTDMAALIKQIGVKKSNFVRYALEKAIKEIRTEIEFNETGKF